MDIRNRMHARCRVSDFQAVNIPVISSIPIHLKRRAAFLTVFFLHQVLRILWSNIPKDWRFLCLVSLLSAALTIFIHFCYYRAQSANSRLILVFSQSHRNDNQHLCSFLHFQHFQSHSDTSVFLFTSTKFFLSRIPSQPTSINLSSFQLYPLSHRRLFIPTFLSVNPAHAHHGRRLTRTQCSPE